MRENNGTSFAVKKRCSKSTALDDDLCVRLTATPRGGSQQAPKIIPKIIRGIFASVVVL